ncbi:hypothetical protein [Ruegeria atlantica]|uniref:hypothetical protein n=1 Tax=Ruegeria atlantica TaxID=81569 RepID=UPI001F376F40|nr:hypothetical protein [Ruegeria atlantica]
MEILGGYTVDFAAYEDGKQFNHNFMSFGENATWLVCALGLAEATNTGFMNPVPEERRSSIIAEISDGELPLIEDACQSVLCFAEHYFGITPTEDWPANPTRHFFLNDCFADLGLMSREDVWHEAALPMLIRAGHFQVDDMMNDEKIAAYVRKTALSSFETMPDEVFQVMLDDENSRRPRPSWRLDHFFARRWRYGTWLTVEQDKVACNFGPDPLIKGVVNEIAKLRSSARH